MKQVVVYGVLLTVAMVGAYVSWTSDVAPTAEGAEESVAVYSARSGDVKKLAFDGENVKVSVERRTDAKGDFVWVAIDETKAKPTPPKPHDHGSDPHGGDEEGDPDGSSPDGASPDDAPVEAGPEVPEEPEAEPEPEMETVHTEFLGNESAVGLFESFEPLMAKRELASGDSSDPKAFGLDEPSGHITVTRSAGDTTIDLGGETYGAKDRYGRHDGRMFLLEDTTIRPLQFAGSRLVERRVHPLLENELDSVVVRHAGKAVELVQRNKDDRQAAFWARQGEDSKDDIAATWLDKLFRLKAAEYPLDVDLSGATQVFAVDLTANSETWTFTVLQDTAAQKVYARSDFNRGTVELTASLADEAISDIGELFEE
ncbi:MAG: DUF4340 domain-containing protein [Myxococcota bacterium]